MTDDSWAELRQRTLEFIEQLIYPLEGRLAAGPRDESRSLMRGLMRQAKEAGLWAPGHPVEIGGQGMPFLDYVRVNEVIGRSHYAMQALGTLSLQDSLMLRQHASEEWKEKYLAPLVAGEFVPSFAMTEPGVSSSDPTQLQTRAVLEGDQWRISGRKWFTTGAADAAYTTVMCRTESDVPPHRAFSMIIVPTSTPGYRIVRDYPVLGMEEGHYEIELNDVLVPQSNLVGERGQGFIIAQQRLGPGRIFHCMRWLGQAQRAFDLMCRRLNERVAFGSPLAEKQLMQQHVFDSAAEIHAVRCMTLDAAAKLDRGLQARDEIAMIKVVGARMVTQVTDRAIQVFGAEGLTPLQPLERMFRHAREARIYDGPDEVHIQSTARRMLRRYGPDEPGVDFGTADELVPPRRKA
ncbi:MAG: acyl-CoA dehydrogenase family protein [Gammaproteobacteria bacterium]|nr:acyl-CoA dehydrogenase family protein [Gammaproteobacteria bacterium]